MRIDTKARSIPKAVKLLVAERDSIDGWPCCIYCGTPSPDGGIEWSNAHYIGRAQEGLGNTPENILTLCPDCHRRYDQTTDRNEMRNFFREYLMERYPMWSEDKLVYRRLYAD
jgi:5-methylcytosine-specific restriction endonuclease McrA